MSDNNNRSIQVKEQEIKSSQITKTYEISPEIMANIKESCMYVLRNDKDFVKQIFSEYVKNNSEDVKRILSESINKINDIEINFRSIDKITAKKEIQDYINKHQGCLISDLIEDLRIDPELILEIVNEFKKENLLTTKSVD